MKPKPNTVEVPTPPTAITEQTFRDMVKEKETEKDKMKPCVKPSCSKSTTPTETSHQMSKTKIKFQTPYDY